MRLQQLVETYGIRFKKALGQNLLLDENINRIMVDAAALGPEDAVIEVGAGLGALTARLAEQAGRVLAIEIDPSFMPCLEDRFGGFDNVALFRGDVMNHELAQLADEFLPGSERYKMVSNLPYYITTPILFEFWESSIFFERCVVMVQEEVALRLVAAPGSKDYGVLTLAAQVYAEADLVHRAPASCFRPRPKVDSCIVRLRNRPSPVCETVPTPFLMRVVRAAFAQRRKTLRNALTKSSQFGAPAEAVLAAFEETGIDPGRRAETLGLQEYAALASAIHARVAGDARGAAHT